MKTLDVVRLGENVGANRACDVAAFGSLFDEKDDLGAFLRNALFCLHECTMSSVLNLSKSGAPKLPKWLAALGMGRAVRDDDSPRRPKSQARRRTATRRAERGSRAAR